MVNWRHLWWKATKYPFEYSLRVTLCSFSTGDFSFSVAASVQGIETLSGDCFLMWTSWIAIELQRGVGGSTTATYRPRSGLSKWVRSVGLTVHPAWARHGVCPCSNLFSQIQPLTNGKCYRSFLAPQHLSYCRNMWKNSSRGVCVPQLPCPWLKSVSYCCKCLLLQVSL